MKPYCEMARDCEQEVTHIGDEGYVYCARHAALRRASGYERCRKMRQWECALIAADKPVPSYKVGRRPDAQSEKTQLSLAFEDETTDIAPGRLSAI
jgi:hypothetical protein